jgi:hypothetical protein
MLFVLLAMGKLPIVNAIFDQQAACRVATLDPTAAQSKQEPKTDEVPRQKEKAQQD